MESNTTDENALKSTPERSNFQRFSVLLVVGGKETLQKLLESKLPPETNFQDFITDSKTKSLIFRHLTRPQKELLYASSGVSVVVRDLDISIIFKLLRNACGLTEPAKGWDELPDERDESLEADMARIKFYRNSVYGHNPSMTISCDQFYVLWMAISTALVRIAGHVSTECKSQLQAQIGKLMSEPVDQRQVNKQIEVLMKWVEEERGERKEMMRVLTHQSEMLKKVNDKSQEIQANVEALLNKSINPQQTSSPTSEQGSQVVNPQYSPTTISNTVITNINTLHISGQPPTTANPASLASSPVQLESLSPFGSPPNNTQQSCTLPLAPGQSNGVSPRMRYTRQLGHDDSVLPASSGDSNGTVPHSHNAAVQLLRTGKSEPTLSERDRAPNNESFIPEFARKVESHIAPQYAAPSSEPKKYRYDTPRINETSEYRGAGYSSDTAARHGILTTDGYAPRAAGQNWQVGGHGEGASDEGAAVEQPRSGYMIFSVTCKVINQDSLPTHVQSQDCKENRVTQFLAEKYINLSSTEPSDFLKYLQKNIQLTVEGVHVQDNTCVVEVSSTSQAALDMIWSEYICGNLREITKCILITKEVLDNFAVSNHQLTLEVAIDAQGHESPLRRCNDTKRSKSLNDESQGGEYEVQRHNYRRTKSDLDTDLETTKVAQELYEIICKSGGSLQMLTALSKLSRESREIVEIVNHNSADSFAKRFEDLFIVKDGGYTIDAIVNIRFCKVEQKQGCSKKRCPDLHLCPFHIADKMKCIYKDICKHSHDVSDDHTTFVFSLHGLENLTVKERYKLLQFITSDPVKRFEWMAPSSKLPKICKYYNNSPGCKDGEQCSFLHVCRHWILDDCDYGKLCKRAHEFDANREVGILERHNIGHMLEDELLKTLRETLHD